MCRESLEITSRVRLTSIYAVTLLKSMVAVDVFNLFVTVGGRTVTCTPRDAAAAAAGCPEEDEEEEAAAGFLATLLDMFLPR